MSLSCQVEEQLVNNRKLNLLGAGDFELSLSTFLSSVTFTLSSESMTGDSILDRFGECLMMSSIKNDLRGC